MFLSCIFINMRKKLKENSFEGGVSGFGGTVNTQPGYGTFASPDASQTPNNFNSSLGNHSNTAKDGANPEYLKKDLNSIYTKTDVPSPDEIVTGIKYEMGQQLKKNKQLAKEIVVKNLKQNPHFYSELGMLNIDDKTMMNNINEEKQHPNDGPKIPTVTINIEETKKIFADMTAENDKKWVVNSKICDVMKLLWDDKRKRNAWKTGK